MYKDRLISLLSGPLLIIFLALAYSMAACFVINMPFLSVFLASMLTFTLIGSNLKLIKNRKIAYTFLILTIIKLVLLILNAKYKVPFMAGVDWLNYHNYAQAAVASGDSVIDIFNNSIDFFVFIMALIYKIFGINAEQIYFYIFPLSLLLTKYVHKTALLLSKKQSVADVSSLVMTLWPVNLIFSVALLREIPIQLLVIVSFYKFLLYHFYKKVSNLFFALLWIILAALMHSGMIGIFIVYLYALMQDRFYNKYKFIRIGGLIVMALIVGIISLTPLWGSMSKRFTSSTTESGVVTALENQNRFLGDAATNYVTSVPQDLGGVITSIPYRFTMFTLAPLPWQVHDIVTVASFVLDGALQLFVLFTLIRIYRARSKLSKQLRNIGTLIMMCILSTYLLFSLGTSNYGTAMRHRAKVAPLIVVLITVYHVGNRKAKS